MTKTLRKIYMYFKFKKFGISANVFNIARQLEKSQFWDRKRIEEHQLNQINSLIEEAKKNVKYYQNGKYNNVSFYESLHSFDKEFPIIKKEDFNINSGVLRNKRQMKSIKHSTSGSSGKPLTVETSSLADAYRFANYIRFFDWWGVDMYDKNVLIWKTSSGQNGLNSFFKKMENLFMGKFKLNVFDLNDDSIHDYVREIDKFKPKYIRGYKSGIFELVRLMEKYDLKLVKTKLKVVVVTAETLFEHERDLMERVLDCRVANEYGSAEAGIFALECPKGSMHVNEESVYISTDKNDAFITELYNTNMPLINYKNEDKVVFSDKMCICGRNLKVIKEIKGRIVDLVHFPDGTKKNSLSLLIPISKIGHKYEESIAQYRITQIGYKLNIEIIPNGNFKADILTEIRLKILEETFNKLEVEVQLVDCLSREKSGKLRSFIRKS